MATTADSEPNPHVVLTCISEETINALRFNSNGKYFMSGGSDKIVKLWNASTGSRITEFIGHGHEVLCLAIANDDTQFASSGLEKQIFLWDVMKTRVIRKFHGHFQKVNCLSFNFDSSVIVSGSYDSTVRIWDCRSKSWEPIQTFKEAKDSVMSIALRDHEIMTGSVDGCIRTYDLRKGVLSIDHLHYPVTSLYTNITSNCLLANILNDKILLMDRNDGRILNSFDGHCNRSYKIESFLDDSEKYVICGSEDGILYVWDTITGAILQKKLCHKRSILALDSYSLDCKFVTGSSDGKLLLWSLY